LPKAKDSVMLRIALLLSLLFFISCSSNKFLNYTLIYSSQDKSIENLSSSYEKLPYLSDEETSKFVEVVKQIDNSNVISKIDTIGTVELVCIVDEEANIESVFISRSLNNILDSLCVQAILNSKFKQYCSTGEKPIKYSFKIRYPFTSKKFYPPNINYDIFGSNLFVDNNNDTSLVFGFNELDEKVIPKHIGNPIYPNEAKQLGIEGTVVITVYIDENGKVIDATLFRSVHPLIDKTSIEEVYRCVFQPGKKNGEYVKSKMNIPFYYKLK
jgi:TonB family protein